MPKFDINNTSQAWGEALLALAQEAARDAAAVDSAFQLRHVLNDLAHVAKAYAGRLGVERIEAGADAAEAEAVAEAPLVASDPNWSEHDGTPPEHVLQRQPLPVPDGGVVDRLAALESTVAGLSEPELPQWLLDMLRNHEERITALENLLSEAQAEVATLKATQQRDTIIIPDHMQPLTPALTLDDLMPESWGSIERARKALSNQVQRTHAELTTMRQSVLNAVTALAGVPNLSDDERAELAQHSERADRLETIDVVRDVKLGEIDALTDLDAARAYDAAAGWPV